MKIKIIFFLSFFVGLISILFGIHFIEEGIKHYTDDNVVAVSLVVISIISIIFSFMLILLNESLSNSKLIYLIIPALLLAIGVFSFTKNSEIVQSYKTNALIETLSSMDKKYPNSYELNEIKLFINNKEYEKLENYNTLKITYLEVLPIVIKTKSYSDVSLNDLLNKFLSDGYINSFENNILVDKMNEIMINSL